MLNYETILSNYDDKLTLMQWLKKVEAALENASATAFHVNKRGNATLTFSIDFADGTSIESDEFVLQQGESVASARISNGQLILTLTNGDELNAGNILNGNVNVNGNISVSNNIETEFLNVRDSATLQEAEIIGGASVGGDLDVVGNASVTGSMDIESASFNGTIEWVQPSGTTLTNLYTAALIVGGVLHIVAFIKLTNTGSASASVSQILANGGAIMPNEYAKRIFNVDGNSIYDAQDGTNHMIRCAPIVVTKQNTGYGFSGDAAELIFRHYNRQVQVAINFANNLTIPAGESRYLMGEMNIVLAQ